MTTFLVPEVRFFQRVRFLGDLFFLWSRVRAQFLDNPEMKTYFILSARYLPDYYIDASNKNNESNQGNILTGINDAKRKIVIPQTESSKSSTEGRNIEQKTTSSCASCEKKLSLIHGKGWGL